MASSRRTYDTDVITLRKVFAKDPGNSNVPALRTLTADGLGGTYWAVPSSLGLNPSFNEIITSAGTYTADLSYNKFRLLAGENIGMLNGSPGSNETILFAKAFSQFDISGENTIVAYNSNNQLDSSVTLAGQGGITLRGDPATNTLFIVGPASNAYTVSTGIYGFSQIKVTEATSTITPYVQGLDGTYITATSPSTLLRMIGIEDIHLSTNVTTGSIFFSISTFTSKGYLDISANAYGSYPSTLSTISSLYVQIPQFLSGITGAILEGSYNYSSLSAGLQSLALSTGVEFGNVWGQIAERAYIQQLLDTEIVLNKNIQSTSVGLGTLGYISTGGGAVVGQQQLVSTVEGLGSAGYISSGVAGDVTTANLVSTVAGLGSSGYVSSLSTIITSTIFNTGAISTYSLEVFGPATLTSGGSTILRGPIYLGGPTFVAGSFTGLPNTIVSPANQQSTVAGLGTSRYVSSLSLQSTVRGLGSASYISSSQLLSSIAGLGSLGYLSSLNGFTISTGNVFTSSLNLLDVYTNDVNYLTVSSGSLLLNGAKVTGGSGGGGNVAQIVAGTGISVDPAGGTGVVTITNTGPTTGYIDAAISSFSTALGPVGGGTGASYNFSTVSSVYASSFTTLSLFASTMNTATILPSPSNLWVGVGYGASAAETVQYSGDARNWSNSTSGGFGTAGKGVAYNGSMWIAVGANGSALGSIQTSTDGKNWFNITSGGFSAGANGIAYNGTIWIAVGNNGGDTATSIQYSRDGRNWFGITSGGFSVNGEGVAWNGSYWVATGQGGSVAETIQYSIDGLNWISATSGGFTTAGKGVAYNGSLWVAAGDDVTSLPSLQYSGDGKNWSNAVTGGFSSAAWKVAWNGSLWVAVGDDTTILKSIQYSIDGMSWNDIASGGFTNGSDGYGIAWNGSYWVAVGAGNTGPQSIQISSDGIHWTSATTGGFSFGGVGIGFSSNLAPGYSQQNLQILSQNIPLFLTPNNQILAKPSSLVVNDTLYVDRQYKRVAVNCNTPAYDLDVNGIGHFLTLSTLGLNISSLNGANYPSILPSTVRGLGTVGYVSTSGVTSTVVGLGTTGYVSTSGLTSTVRGLGTVGYVSTSGLTSTVAGLGTTWFNSTIAGLGTVGYVSTSGLTSTVAGLGTTWFNSTIAGLGTVGYVSTSGLTSTVRGLGTVGYVSTSGLTSTVAGLGQQYVSTLSNVSVLSSLAINASSITAPVISSLAMNVSTINGIPFGLPGYPSTVSTNYALAFNTSSFTVSSMNFVNVAQTPTNLWVAVGSGNNASDNILYSTDGSNWTGASSGGFSSKGYNVAWNGRLWVAVGEGDSAAESIQYSTDGINWTNSSTGGFSTMGRAIAWNGRLWVAVGNGGSTAATIKYSSDGINWTNSASGGFSTQGIGIAWNGRIWVAVGQGGTTIQYSTDGINWTGAASGTFSSYGVSVAWNGRIWVAGGLGASTAASIQYSTDGSNWSNSLSGGFSGGTGCVAWNGRMWLAGGVTGLQYSFDGINWTSFNTTLSIVYGLAWNGRIWIALCINSFDERYAIRYSFDGFIWYIASNNGFGGDGNGAAYSSNLTPAYNQTNFEIEPQNIPNYLTSTNQLSFLASTIIANNTLFVDATNRVGINTGSPQTDLDVAGIGRFQTLSTLALNLSSINGANFATILPSTVAGLGTVGYVSTSGLTSTVRGLGTTGYVSTSGLTSTVAGLGTVGYISTSALTSTVRALGTVGSSITVSTGYLYASSMNFVNLAQTPTNLWVAVGSGGSAAANIQYSTDGINWTNSSTGGFASQGYGVAWNGRLWVAVGNGGSALANIKYSTDGSNWTNSSTGGFASQGRGVAWNGRLWVAVGSGGTALANTQYSTDGINWTNSSSGGFTTVGYSVAWNGRIWVAVGNGGSAAANIQYSTDGINWTNSSTGGFSSLCFAVAWNGRIWVAVGSGGSAAASIKYSTDGINWTNSSSGGFSTQGIGVAWNGLIWVAVGQGGSGIQYSTDGINWTAVTNNSFSSYGFSVAWNGSRWVAVGNNGGASGSIKYSTDGINWTNNASGGFSTEGDGIAYSANLIPSYNQGNFEIEPQNIPVFLRSTNTMSFLQSSILLNNTLTVDTTNRVGINTVSPQYGLDVNGSARFNSIFVPTPTTVGSPNLWVAVGTDTLRGGIQYSLNGSNWTASAATNAFSGGVYGIAWNGSMWLALGSDTTQNIKYSYDGNNWSNASGARVFTSYGLGAAWNGRAWVAVGQDSTAASTIRYSTDGMNWSIGANGGFTVNSYAVAWNGSMWVAVGQNSPTDANTIKYSYDGSNWSNAASGGFSSKGLNIAWNGRLWVAVGNSGGATGSIKYSTDGINWTNNATGGFSTEATGISWNGRMWVASGNNSSNATGSIQYSSDGITWSSNASGGFSNQAWNAAWNGSYWLAAGQITTTLSTTIQLSTDGINWINNTTTGGLSLVARNIAYSSNLVPSYNQTNFEIEPQNIPVFLRSTNTMSFLPSTVITNNTLFVDTTNRVGINTGNPQYALDVNGISRFSSMVNVNLTQTPTNLWVASGSDATQNMKYSYDGINWSNAPGSKVFSGEGRGVAWNGSMWVVVGVDTTQNVKYSYNGLNWSNAAGSAVFATTGGGFSVAWNGRLWVGIGNNTSNQNVKYSSDGINWSNAAGSQVFVATGNGIGRYVVWNGKMWVAVGVDDTQNIKYSYDGVNWLSAAGSKAFSTAGYSLAWNGLLWLAGGDDTTQSIKYSYDGINWTNVPGTKVFANNVVGILWNGSMWVAVGDNGASQTVKYSYDGFTWVSVPGSLVFSSGAYNLAWNGTLWNIVGQDATQNIKYSYDGVNWLSAAGSKVFSSYGSYIAYSANLIPSYNQTNFEIEPQNIPVFLRSTNQMSFTQSSIILNNTLFVDATNKVGINTGSPQYTLDVNGSSRVSSLIVGIPTTNPSTSAFLLNLTRDSATKPFTTAWTAASDQRIKENITDADYDRCYNDVKALQLRRFTWASSFYTQYDGYDKRVLGFIAQEVSSIVPKAVTVSEANGYSNFHYLNVDQLNMSLYGAVKKTILDKEYMDSTIKGQRITIETLVGTQNIILSTLEGLQGR